MPVRARRHFGADQEELDLAGLWTGFVASLVEAIGHVGTWLGGGELLGVFAVTFVIRSILIPLLGPLAARTRERQKVVRRIRPEIKRINKELRDHPGELSRRLKALHRENGIEVVDWSGLVGAMVQLPVLIALFQAALILREPEALTLGGTGLGVVAAGLAVGATRLSGQDEGAPWMLWLSGILPILIGIWLGMVIGLYLTAFYAAGVLQALVMPKPDASSVAGDRSA